LTEQNVAASVLNALSGSFQITPMFFVNWKNGVNYNLVAQTPQYRFQSMNDLLNIPLNTNGGTNMEILGDVASVTRGHEMGLINHYNIRRVIDIYGAVQDRDLGAVSRDVKKVVSANQKLLPRGTFIAVRGQVQTMRTSYLGLLGGLGLAVVLVYMLIVVNFQSWLDPFIIITALPAALTGIVSFLFLTHTTLSVPALMGALMCMGIATANSILVVSFAKERLHEHGDSPSGHRSRSNPVPSCNDDGIGDGDRHGPYGSWVGRRWRAERTTWSRRYRGIDGCDRSDAAICSRRFQSAPSWHFEPRSRRG
jgi:multidrug efflux pump subunit AcrB